MISIYYINNIYLFVYYQEANVHYVYNYSSSRKFKEPLNFLLLNNIIEITKQAGLFLYMKKKKKKNYYYNSEIAKIESKKNIFFKEVLYENKSKIKIIGRGWKIVKYPYELIVKLGYSHSIFLTLDPFIKLLLKKKNDKFYIFYGVRYEKLNTVMAKFNFMRVPNIYTRKGIFHRKIIL